MMKCPYICAVPIRTPIEQVTDRIQRCEDSQKRGYLESVRAVYGSDLLPADMAKRLMELRRG